LIFFFFMKKKTDNPISATLPFSDFKSYYLRMNKVYLSLLG